MPSARATPTGTRLPRPTARGVAVAVLAVLLWGLGAFSGLHVGLEVSAALLVLLVLCALMALLSSWGLGLRRRVLDPTVTAPGSARVELELAPGALVSRVPLAPGVVRCELPAALGGMGEIVLSRRMPHRLVVARRGVHELGPCTIDLRDVFGLFTVRRTEALPATVVGLPEVEPIDGALVRRARLSRSAEAGAGAGRGAGELGTLARQYVAGDDLRRIHWRASARTGGLMTREDEPVETETAVIVLDDRRFARDGAVGTGAHAEGAHRVEERLVSAVATLGAMLRRHGWSVRVLDARGDEIVHAGTSARTDGMSGAPGTPGTGALAGESGALDSQEALLALARLEFHDVRRDVAVVPPAGGVTTGDTALALVLAPDDDVAGSGPAHAAGGIDGAGPGRRLPELVPLCGHAGRRIAVLLSPAPTGPLPQGGHGPAAPSTDPTAPGGAVASAARGLPGGSWTVVRCDTTTSFSAVVDALDAPAGGSA